MPSAEHVTIDVADIALTRTRGQRLLLGALSGVHVVVLLRHRH